MQAIGQRSRSYCKWEDVTLLTSELKVGIDIKQLLGYGEQTLYFLKSGGTHRFFIMMEIGNISR